MLIAPALAVGAVGALLAPQAHAVQVQRDVPVSRMYYRYVSIPPWSTYTYETTNLSVGTDTVLHLWDHLTQTEVGYDDDGGVGLASRVSFSNSSGSTRTLMLFARSYSSGSEGSADLLQNGSTLVSNMPVAGKRFVVENGEDWIHETAMATDGARYPYLIGLDASRHMTGVNFSSGVEAQAALWDEDAYYVVVGTTSGSGNIHLYSNDPTDYDGDGLGYWLEMELGTCDVSWWSGCTGVNNLADTDRDGLSDGLEVFGADDFVNPQHLAAWGADPLHKDVFVELDYNDSHPSQPWTEDDAEAAAAMFAAGLAGDLANPDGQDGVRLHIDAGVTATDPANRTLIGDWGGSNAVPDGTAYQDAPDTYRSTIRAGVFRYGLLNVGAGGGQASGVPGDRFNWGVSMSYRYPRSFSHELGHSLGISHHGHDSWGVANGKANYRSLMNYAYPVAEFSQGESTVTLNPASIVETAGIGADATHVGQSPFNREIGPNDEIDWDFDGEFSPSGWGSVRGPLTFAGSSSTSSFTRNEQDLHTESDLPGTTPALLHVGNRMYAFYIDDNRIYYRHALMNGQSYFASCPGGDELGDTCTTWSGAIQVPTSANALGVTAETLDGEVLLAFRSTNNEVRTIHGFNVQSSGVILSWNNEWDHWGDTDKEPEVHLMRVDPALFGTDVVLGLFYRDIGTGRYRWRSMNSIGQVGSVYRSDLRNESGVILSGTQSPTLANWPFDPTETADGTACAALTNTASQARFYCYDRDLNRFVDLTPTAFGTAPVTSGKPGLIFHTYRSWAGLPRNNDSTRGAFWLTVVNAHAKWDYPDVWMSTPVSENVGEELLDLSFPTTQRGEFGNVWSNLIDGSGLALYDDPTLGSLKALWLRQDQGDDTVPQGAKKLRFLPIADGSFRADLRDGNDFQIMERGICRGLASSSYCGPSSFGLD